MPVAPQGHHSHRGGHLIGCSKTCFYTVHVSSSASSYLGLCITGHRGAGMIGSIGGGLTGGDRRVHHWVQHRTRHRASGEGVKMVAPVASANRASAEDDGSLITIKVNGAKKK